MQIRQSVQVQPLQPLPISSTLPILTQNPSQIPSLESDQLQVAHTQTSLLKPNTPPVTSTLNLKLTDNDGFVNFGQNDVSAQISGQIKVSPDFILNQLNEVKTKLPEDIQINEPYFDAERQQFVLKGKAMNKILWIDVGFEIRVGAQNDQLAVRVDNFIKRPIIYHVLKNQLAKLGLEGQKKNRHFLLTPAYGNPITVPLSKDKSQTGQIEEILSNPENLKFAINEDGQLTITLDNVGVKISTDLNTENSQKSAPDSAELDFSLSIDNEFKPTIQILDGDVNASATPAELKQLLGDAITFEQPVAIDLEDLSGEVQVGKGQFELELNAQGQSQSTLKKDGLAATINTNGNHAISLNQEGIDIQLESASINGDYTVTRKDPTDEETEESSKKNKKPVHLTVENLDAEGTITANGIQVDASIQEGGLEITSGESTTIKTNATLEVNADGERLEGQSVIKGAEVTLDSDKNISIQLNDQQGQGSFTNKSGKLSISGQVDGQTQIHLNAQKEINIEHSGQVEALVDSQGKVKIDGTGQSARFDIDRDKNLHIELEDMNMMTDVTIKENRISAHSTGQSATIDITPQGPIAIETQGTSSEVGVKIKEMVKGSGTVGDMSMAIQPKSEGGGIDIQARDGNFDANITNKSGNMNVDVHTEADIQIQVQGNNQIRLASSQGQTEVEMTLKGKDGRQKVDLESQGSDFDLRIAKGDVDVNLEDATYKGTITPNQKMAVDVQSQSPSALDVSIAKKGQENHIEVSSEAPISGRLSLEEKLQTTFSNEAGFDLDIVESKTHGTISTSVSGLTIEGDVTTPKAQSQIQGVGNLELDIQKRGPVNINYDGQFNGRAQVTDLVDGIYDINGPVDVTINKKDVDVDVAGEIKFFGESSRFGIDARGNINQHQQGFHLEVRDKKINLSLEEEGFLQVEQLSFLKLDNREVEQLLHQYLRSNTAQIGFKDLQMNNSGETLSVKLQVKEIETEFGQAETIFGLEKGPENIQIHSGVLGFEPNLKFFEFVKDTLTDKYGFRLDGTPSFENGELRIRGEVRSPLTGLIEMADFNIKASVDDNKLILDLDKAQLLNMVGTEQTGSILDNLLDRNKLDAYERESNKIEIDLGEIAKNLALTQGVNFTKLQLVGSRIESYFYFNSDDQEVAKLAKKKDIAGIKEFVATHDLSTLSGESMATIFDIYADAKETQLASDLITQMIRSYTEVSAHSTPEAYASQYELERGMEWAVNSLHPKAHDIEDNIALKVTQSIGLNTSQGQAQIKAIPRQIVIALANNMDLTLSQGGPWSVITTQERRAANQLRQLVGEPLNKRHF